MTEVATFLKGNQSYVRQRFYDPSSQRVGGVYPKFLRTEKYGSVAKTLICVSGHDPYCLVLGYDRRANLKALARTLGASRFQLAKRDEVTELTGFKIGSVSPVMPERKITTIFDSLLADHPYIYVNGGQPGVQLRVKTNETIALLSATVVSFSEPI